MNDTEIKKSKANRYHALIAYHYKSIISLVLNTRYIAFKGGYVKLV